ncbi:MAG: LysR family transcriptional regulator [Actinomycetota bacterium]
MDVRQLSAIVAIADHGTFSAAARALYTVQSNVSGHVARLEKELGVTLVDRANGGLTDDGARVVERARRVLNDIDDIAAEVGGRSENVAGQVRMGVIGTTARWLMPALLHRLGEQHPNVRAIVHEGATSTLVPNASAGELNAAVIHLPVDDPDLVVDPLFAEDLMLLVPDDHELHGNDHVPLAAIDGMPLLLPPTGSALRKVLDRAAAAANVRLLAHAEIDGVRLIASLAFDGFGPAIVPATAAPTWVTGDFGMIPVPELPRRVVASVRRRRPAPSSATQVLLETLRDVVREQAGRQSGVHLETTLL